MQNPELEQKLSEKQSQCIQIIQDNVESFKNINETNIEIKKLTGLTNETYRIKNISKPDNNQQSPQTVLLRIFGQCEGLIDQEKEHQIFYQLGQLGVGPKCYKHNPGKWRIEEFIEKGVHPDHDLLGQQYFRDTISIYLSKFHQQKIDIKHEQPLIDFQLQNTQLFEQFNQKMNRKGLYNQKEMEGIDQIKELIKPEFLEFLQRIKPKTHLYLCHNDANNLNIFYNEGELQKQIIFIDYEYARTNYAAYDIANFMGETCFNYNIDHDPYFKYETQNQFSENQIYRFAMLYEFVCQYPNEFQELEKHILSSQKNELQDYNNQIENHIKQKLTNNWDQFINEVTRLTQEIQASQIITCWYWSIWSVLTSKPEIEMDFNHIEHGLQRVKLLKYYQDIYQQKYLNQ